MSFAPTLTPPEQDQGAPGAVWSPGACAHQGEPRALQQVRCCLLETAQLLLTASGMFSGGINPVAASPMAGL